MSLSALGWTDFFEVQLRDLDPETFIARVIAEQRGRLTLSDGEAERLAAVRGKLRRTAAVGDFVVARPAGEISVVERVLARRTQLSRKAAGRAAIEQVLAANLDAAFVVMGLDDDFSRRRAERYAALVREGGVRLVLVLNKADLADELEARLAELAPLEAEIHAISAKTGLGVDRLAASLRPSETIALLGSSGAGKSTLLNRLAGGELARTGEIRDDGTGRHTTTHRALFRLPSGALVLDAPGLREVQLWGGELDLTFPEIEALAAACRFRDCRHDGEPGCAVEAASERGEIEPDRLRSWRSLRGEVERVGRGARGRVADKQRVKSSQRALRRFYRDDEEPG